MPNPHQNFSSGSWWPPGHDNVFSVQGIIVATPGGAGSGFGFRARGLRLIGFKGRGIGNSYFPLKKYTPGELVHHQPEAVLHAPGCADFTFRSSSRQEPPRCRRNIGVHVGFQADNPPPFIINKVRVRGIRSPMNPPGVSLVKGVLGFWLRALGLKILRAYERCIIGLIRNFSD